MCVCFFSLPSCVDYPTAWWALQLLSGPGPSSAFLFHGRLTETLLCCTAVTSYTLATSFLGTTFLGTSFLGTNFLAKNFLGTNFLGTNKLGTNFLGATNFFGTNFLG